jgi:hypothetical protein
MEASFFGFRERSDSRQSEVFRVAKKGSSGRGGLKTGSREKPGGLRAAYRQTDAATILEVVLEAGE